MGTSHTMHILQEEELDERNLQVAPPGFHVIFLPYADDFRKLKFEEGQPKGRTFPGLQEDTSPRA